MSGARPRSVKVSDALWLAARQAADRRGETVSDVIRAALARYVKRDEKDRRQE